MMKAQAVAYSGKKPVKKPTPKKVIKKKPVTKKK
tara:strand:+ start:9110 stop:9211 length:102 start_codon:yes stop_codon:yes gene_type:complete